MAQVKESLRYALTTGEVGCSDIHIPTIDDNQDMKQWEEEYKIFLMHIWNLLFEEPFKPADLSKYRKRIDREFVQFPHMPELWKKAEYE